MGKKVTIGNWDIDVDRITGERPNRNSNQDEVSVTMFFDNGSSEQTFTPDEAARIRDARGDNKIPSQGEFVGSQTSTDEKSASPAQNP